MKRGTLWPVGIASILLLTVIGNIVVYTLANDDPSFAVEPDYYQKAVRWDEHMAQERHNAALGWRLVPTMGAMAPGGATLVVRLTDAAGAPLDGATVTVAAMSVARAADVLHATLARDAAGDYAARLPVARGGQWELRFTAVRGTERFTSLERVDVPVRAGS